MTPWTAAYQTPPSMGFSRQEYWSGLPFPSPGDLPDPGIEPRSPAFQADALTSEPPGKPLRILCKHQEISTYPALREHLLLLWRGLVFSGSLPCGTCCCVLVPQSCLTICDPMDCSLPGSSVHGIFQARILEWVAIPFSRASSQSKNGTWVFCIAG